MRTVKPLITAYMYILSSGDKWKCEIKRTHVRSWRCSRVSFYFHLDIYIETSFLFSSCFRINKLHMSFLFWLHTFYCLFCEYFANVVRLYSWWRMVWVLWKSWGDEDNKVEDMLRRRRCVLQELCEDGKNCSYVE